MGMNYRKALVAALLLITGVSGSVAAAGPVGVDPAAQAVAQTYFDALQAGDRRALLGLFAGRERMRSEAQLSDPDYSRFLVDRYRNARLEVTGGGERSGVSYVDVTIWINDSEAVRERLILKPSGEAGGALSIVARKELD